MQLSQSAIDHLKTLKDELEHSVEIGTTSLNAVFLPDYLAAVIEVLDQAKTVKPAAKKAKS